MPAASDTAIVLFRRDLRLRDHPALTAACAECARVIAAYIHAPQEEGEWKRGSASNWWLHHSLSALSAEIAHQGGKLHISRGDTLQALLKLIESSGARRVYWSRRYEPGAIESDTRLKAALHERGVTVESHPGNLWREPWTVATNEDAPYRVFTPYWRKLRSTLIPDKPLPRTKPAQWERLTSMSVDDLDLLPKIDWTRGFTECWRPGEAGAWQQLEIFEDDALRHYKSSRDLPARHGTSRLSPHLHFGEITPRQIHHALNSRSQRVADVEPYLRELGWREFANHLLYHFPKTPTENFNPRFDGFRWANFDREALKRWQRGLTGVPLVDAGMRELWHTGWMHNRVRMVVASFLTKNLRQHWSHGARWFWDTLVDADLANNTLGWQWVAGTGADAAPYFRVFNPLTQAKKFDPDASYIRRWVPELARLPNGLIHNPTSDLEAIQRTGYPAPWVDIGESRQAALAAWDSSLHAR